MHLNMLSKNKLHPGIEISWLHCAQGIILMQNLQEPGLVISKQTWPHQDNNKGFANALHHKFQLLSGQGEAERAGALQGQTLF